MFGIQEGYGAVAFGNTADEAITGSNNGIFGGQNGYAFTQNLVAQQIAVQRINRNTFAGNRCHKIIHCSSHNKSSPLEDSEIDICNMGAYHHISP